MKLEQQHLTIETPGRGMLEITDRVAATIRDSGIRTGLCQVFCRHTSASLTLTENADPSVRRDMERYMATAAPDGDPAHEHAMEGPDDMSAHIRTVLTDAGVTIPVSDGRPVLGTWQGVFLWEHRTRPHSRRLTVTVLGED
ncbi:MAG: secondary thiamine-phosphate synthase enzyme YjbQ [Pseudomonadota bacterium]